MPWPFSTNHRDEVSGSIRAERDAALSRLWDATRPVEPDDATWDAVWTQVRARIDSPGASAETPLTLPARPWRRAATAALILAQAAALLAAAVIWSFPQHSTQRPVAITVPVPTPAPVQVARGTIDIVPGQIVVIHTDGAKVRAETVLQEAGASDGLAGFVEVEDFYVMFNKVEAGFETHLAQND